MRLLVVGALVMSLLPVGWTALDVRDARADENCPAPVEPASVGDDSQVSLPAHLMWIKDDSTRWDDTYVMTQDIDMGSCIWSRPIAPELDGALPAFTGSFDGGGYEIQNLTVAVSTASLDDSQIATAGFIGSLDEGGRLGNITFRDATVSLDDTNAFTGDDSIYNSGRHYVGVAAARVFDSGPGGTALNDVAVIDSNVEVTIAQADVPNNGQRPSFTGGVAGWADTLNVSGITSVGNTVRSVNSQVTGQFDLLENYAGGAFGVRQGDGVEMTSSDDSVFAAGLRVSAGGIAGVLYQATLTGSRVEQPDVSVETTELGYAGGAVGRVSSSTGGLVDARVSDGVVRVLNTETRSGEAHAGGAIGYNIAGYASGIVVTGTTVRSAGGTFVTAGGIVGAADGPLDDTLAQLSADAEVFAISEGGTSSEVAAGGAVGYLAGQRMISASATGDASAVSDDTSGFAYAGGLVGNANTGSVSESFATGEARAFAFQASGDAEAGGLVGVSRVAISRAYSLGLAAASSLFGDDTVGGLVGSVDAGAVSEAYWNTDTSELATSAGGTGLTSAQMRQRSSFANWGIVDGWQAQTFTGTPSVPAAPFWGQCAYDPGFPFLLWQHSANPCSEPPPPPPPPVFPPSAPLNVSGVAGDASAVIAWSAPASAGSFPVTNYQVLVSPGGATCAVPAPAVTCTVAGLTNGVEYTATVRALNGAGWGPYSAPSSAFTPEAPAQPSITITGTRGEVRGRPGVRVTGTTVGFEQGSILRPWFRFPGQAGYAEGSARILVSDQGDFTWERRTGKKIYVTVRSTDGAVTSNRIIVPAR